MNTFLSLYERAPATGEKVCARGANRSRGFRRAESCGLRAPRLQVLAARCAGVLLLGIFLCLPAWSGSAFAQERRPNIVFLFADDLGYGDLGSFGQKIIRTPHLDRMAAEGMRFTAHYAGSPVCAPARYVLMTGKHPGRGHVRGNRGVPPEGNEPVPLGEPTIPELLKTLGYTNGGFGKWGLGGPGTFGDPLKRGFDRFYGYLGQGHAHVHYPTYLWDNDRRVELNNHEISTRQTLPEGLDPYDPANYAIYEGNEYAPDLFSEEALRFIRDNRDRPFFLYYPTTIPHLMLQVPEDSLEEYIGKFPDPPYTGHNGGIPHRAPLAAYAAMITRMDREIGRMMDLVQELGLERDTIFIFTSDNGPNEDGGGKDAAFFSSTGVYRGGKRSLYEGGVRVPLIVRWPGRVQAGTVSDRMTGFEDWLPTLLEMTGARDLTPQGIDGISFAPTILGRTQPERPFLYREFVDRGGQQAVWMGDWKGVRQNLNRVNPPHDLSMELYNLREDPSETTDLAARHPEIVERIARIMREERTPSELFPIRALDLMAAPE